MNKKQLLSLMIGVALCGGAVYALRFGGPPKTPEEADKREEITREWLGQIEVSPIKVTSKNPYTVSYTNTKGLTRYPDKKTATNGIEITNLSASYNPIRDSIDINFGEKKTHYKVDSVNRKDFYDGTVFYLGLKNTHEKISNVVMNFAERVFPPAYGSFNRSRGARRLHMAIMQMFSHITTNLDYIKKNYLK